MKKQSLEDEVETVGSMELEWNDRICGIGKPQSAEGGDLDDYKSREYYHLLIE
jgi:hypothetical protein